MAVDAARLVAKSLPIDFEVLQSPSDEQPHNSSMQFQIGIGGHKGRVKMRCRRNGRPSNQQHQQTAHFREPVPLSPPGDVNKHKIPSSYSHETDGTVASTLPASSDTSATERMGDPVVDSSGRSKVIVSSSALGRVFGFRFSSRLGAENKLVYMVRGTG